MVLGMGMGVVVSEVEWCVEVEVENEVKAEANIARAISWLIKPVGFSVGERSLMREMERAS